MKVCASCGGSIGASDDHLERYGRTFCDAECAAWFAADTIKGLMTALESITTAAESYCQSTGHKEVGAAMFGGCDQICAAIPVARAALTALTR